MMGLISFVYPNILLNVSDRNWLAGRAILSPLNNAVDEINELCLNGIPGDLIVCNSADTTIQLDDATRFPTEYLNSISVNGIPPHRLLLKIGAPIMLLRNINPKEGLCNGTRLILMAKHGEMLQCQIAGGERGGRVVFLPRITFTPTSTEEFPMEWKRRQFPVRTSFAMTINKSQGQSLERVGVWLEESVFSHGQLYVACSRVGDPSNIKIAVKKHNDYPQNATRNVVYKEVFQTGRLR
jgi:ATP-dependent DNA helicase PIF1